MKDPESMAFSKDEILTQVTWVNNFRFYIGTVFFMIFTFLYIFKIYLAPGYEAAFILGLFLFAYAFLLRYYLATPKNIALGEVIFLSVFIALCDLIFISGFVFFTGGIDSPHAFFYLIALVSIPLMFPYFLPAIFIWAAAASIFYISILWIFYFYLTSLRGLFPWGEHTPQYLLNSTITSSLAIPALLLISSTLVYLLSRYIIRQRKRMERIEVSEITIQDEITALSNISWALSRVYDLNYMLEKILDEILKFLKVSSGAILVTNPRTGKLQKRASVRVPSEIIDYLTGREPGAPWAEKEVRKLMTNENLTDLLAKSIIAPRKLPLGLMIFFTQGGEEFSKRGPVILDSIAIEVAIALGYALFVDKFKPPFFKKPEK